jgi:NADP-dependent 3-hydroxy acid dehydrogenase YdfG
MSEIESKVVIITGASSGVGEATARRLGASGAKLMLAARREGRLKDLVAAIQKTGGTVPIESPMWQIAPRCKHWLTQRWKPMDALMFWSTMRL